MISFRKFDVATVTIVFSKEAGGPPVSVSDAVAWTEALLKGDEVEGFNSLRYSSTRIVSASIEQGPN